MSDLVDCVWNGPFVGEIVGHGAVRPGETVAVTREQSQSPHFIQASRARKSAPAEAPAESEAAV